jgi:small subunit ribosomal protein S15
MFLPQKGEFSGIIPTLLERIVFQVKFYTHQEAVMALDTAKKTQIITKFQKKEGDTGSSEVQIALLSTRIAALTEHLKTFKKDHSSRLGLLKLVGQRRRLMRYLKRTNKESYNKIIAELGVRDNI